MSMLVLAARDAEDLEIISARLQDAVARLGDLVYLKKQHRFVAMFNRFLWETDKNLRVRCGLHFDGVLAVKCQKMCQQNADTVVELLAVHFIPSTDDAATEDPAGTVELVFAGGGAIHLTVECLDAAMSDESDAWAARARPCHETTEE